MRQNAERAGLNGENMRIYRAYLPISDHCRVGLGLGLQVVVFKLLEKVTKCGST